MQFTSQKKPLKLARVILSSNLHTYTVVNMKNLKIPINEHKAVLSFNNIICKKFENLKWKLIKKNIDEILDELPMNIIKNKSEALTKQGEKNA